MQRLPNTGGSEETAQAYLSRPRVINIIYLDLSIQTSGILQQAPALIRRDGIAAAAETHQLHELCICVSTHILSSSI